MKTLADFRQSDGWYKCPDESDAQNATVLLQNGFLGFCCCGMPQENLHFILRGLECIKERTAWPTNGDKQETDRHWSRIRELEKAAFGSDQVMYFFYYWADKEELTEHGGSVPGWLTSNGEQVFSLLLEWSQLPESKE